MLKLCGWPDSGRDRVISSRPCTPSPPPRPGSPARSPSGPRAGSTDHLYIFTMLQICFLFLRIQKKDQNPADWDPLVIKIETNILRFSIYWLSFMSKLYNWTTQILISIQNANPDPTIPWTLIRCRFVSATPYFSNILRKTDQTYHRWNPWNACRRQSQALWHLLFIVPSSSTFFSDP